MFHRSVRGTALAFVLVIGLGVASIPAAPLAVDSPEALARANDYGEGRHAALVDWLADGSLLLLTRFGSAEQLHRVTQPLGMREQLTFGQEPVQGAVAHPADADRVIVLQGRPGERHPSLQLRSLSQGTLRRFGDGRLRQSLPLWAHDGRRIAFAAEPPEGGQAEIYLADATTDRATPEAPKHLAAVEGQDLAVLDWSYDDTRLLLRGRVSAGEAHLYVADVRTGALTQLVPAPVVRKPPVRKRLRGRFAAAPPVPEAPPKPVALGDARFSRDGRGVYFVSTQDAEFAGLHYIDLFTRQGRSLAPQDHADIDGMRLSPDGRHIAYTLNEGGYSRLVLHDLTQRTDLLLPPLPAGSLIRQLRFDADGKRLALTVDSATSPSDIYVLSLGEPPTIARWTRSELGPVDAASLVAPQAFGFATWDRIGTVFRQIPAFIHRPREPGPHPVLIDLHAGLAAPFRPGWDPATQFAVNELGYAVIAPDLRGTPGHGQDFIALGQGALRDDALRDIGALLVWIGLQTDLDRNRVMLRADSAGSTLGRAALAMYSDRLLPWNGPLVPGRPAAR